MKYSNKLTLNDKKVLERYASICLDYNCKNEAHVSMNKKINAIGHVKK